MARFSGMKIRITLLILASLCSFACSSTSSRRLPNAPAAPDLSDLADVGFVEPSGEPGAPSQEVPSWDGSAPPRIPEFELPEWQDVWASDVAALSRDFTSHGFLKQEPEALGRCAFVFMEDLPANARIALMSGALGAGINVQDLGFYTGSELRWRKGLNPKAVSVGAELGAQLEAASGAGLTESRIEWASVEVGLRSPVSDWIAQAPWKGIDAQSVCLVHTVQQSPVEVELELVDTDQVLAESERLEAEVEAYNQRAREFNEASEAYEATWSRYEDDLTAWLTQRRLDHEAQGEALQQEYSRRASEYRSAYSSYLRTMSGWGKSAEPSKDLVPPVWEALEPYQGGHARQPVEDPIELVAFESMADFVRTSSKVVIPCVATRLIVEFISVENGELAGTLDLEWTVPQELVEQESYLVRDAFLRAVNF